MAINKLIYNMDSLKKIQKSLETAKKYRTQIGIFGNKNERGASEQGLTNADIGARHEFGFTIPDGPFKGSRVGARSFLRMPIATHLGDIRDHVKSSVMGLLVQGKIDVLFKLLGIACEKIIDQAFQTSGWGTWKANSPITIILKGSDKPLIDTTQLRRSVASRVNKNVS